MGCVCCSVSSFVSVLLDALERISMCTVCAALICCLLFTMLFIMIIGVGIGYHYCFVQNSVEAMSKAAKAAGALRSGPESSGAFARSIDKAVGRGFAHRLRRDIDNLGLTSAFNNTTKSEEWAFMNQTGLLYENFTLLNATKYTV